MRLHRFIYQFNSKDPVVRITDKNLVKQIKNVLRLKSGQEIILSDGSGNEMLSKIVSINKSYIDLELLEKYQSKIEPLVKSVLYVSVLKKDNFEMVVQKATEVGISEIVPIICERTVKTGIKEDRLEKIIKEASEQSGRSIIPRILSVMDFNKAVALAKNNDSNIFFHLEGEDLALKMNPKGSVGLFIGPEGGFDKNEVQTAKVLNFKIINLGKLTLRAETAAIIGSFLGTNYKL